jgi:hypothetical protein
MTQKRKDHSRVATGMGFTRALHQPSYINRIPAPLDYLRCFASDTAYITPPGHTESPKSYKRRIYTTMRILLKAESVPQEMKITQPWPTTDWERVWDNLQIAPVPEETKSIW